MLVLSIGLPGMFTDWGESVIAALIEHAYGTPLVLFANALDDIAETVIMSNADDLVVSIRQPDARLRRALLASVKPMVVFLDDPARSALNLIAHHGRSVVAAVREVSGCCVQLMNFGNIGNALVLNPQGDAGDPGATIRKLATHLGLQVSEQAFAEILARLAHAEPEDYRGDVGEDGSPGGGGLRATFDALGERDRAILDETLGTYADAFAGKEFGRLIWPRDLFGIADSQPEPAMRDIDIAGRARCLVYGPYMQVFAGRWIARMVLGFSAETVGVPFTVDVAAPDRIAHATITPDAAGVYEVNVEFSIEDPDRPVEVRVWSERPAFEGTIALGFVALTPGPVLVPQAASVEAYLAGRLSA